MCTATGTNTATYPFPPGTSFYHKAMIHVLDIVFSRLTIAEEGCEKILQHVNSGHVLSRLIHSLGVDEAGER